MDASTLDLQSAPEAEWLNKLSAAFEALPPGATLQFRTPGDPRKLVRQLVVKFWGRFDWAPLQEDPGAWLSQIVKRKSPGPTSISEMFSTDHRRCDDLFAQAESAAHGGDAELAAQAFARLELGMQRHFNMEEQGIFKEVERRMGFMGGGPTAVMREEHEQMRGLLGRMAGAIVDGNLDDFLGACETMLYLMEQHNMKEEQVLYDMADGALGADMDELLKRLVLF